MGVEPGQSASVRPNEARNSRDSPGHLQIKSLDYVQTLGSESGQGSSGRLIVPEIQGGKTDGAQGR